MIDPEPRTSEPTCEPCEDSEGSSINGYTRGIQGKKRTGLTGVTRLTDEGAEPADKGPETEGPDNLGPPILRGEGGKYLEGTRAGPGRPPQSWGRAQALRVLDDLVADAGNQEKLRVAMQVAFDQNPLGFFRRIVMPLLPRSAMLGLADGSGGGITIKFISGVDESKL